MQKKSLFFDTHDPSIFFSHGSVVEATSEVVAGVAFQAAVEAEATGGVEATAESRSPPESRRTSESRRPSV